MSAWPLSKLLRELQVRASRELTCVLEADSLWVDDQVFTESVCIGQTKGEALAEELVARHLGRDDFWWLDGSKVFGSPKNRFRAHLPRILSFGFDIGSGMSSGPTREASASLCALFNLGITMFDMLCDREAAGRQQLANFVHPDALHVISSEKKAALKFAEEAATVEDFELRCVLKIVAAFFLEMHDLAESTGHPLGPTLDDLILRAYRAQTICSDWKGKYSPSVLVEAAEQKSSIPFHVMFRIANLGKTADQVSFELPSSLGLVFGLTDDLVDLAKDLRLGYANRFLFEMELNEREKQADSSDYGRALALLKNSYVSDAAKRISLAMRTVLAGLDRSSGLGLSILVWARSWVGQAHEEN